MSECDTPITTLASNQVCHHVRPATFAAERANEGKVGVSDVMMANLSRKSECQAHWRSISRCLQRFTAHPPHLSQVRQGRTDRHWERSSECRGALRFCAMAETFTMTEGEEAAREVREEGYLPKASWRGDRLESRSNAAFNKFPCRRLREALMFLSMAGRL